MRSAVWLRLLLALYTDSDFAPRCSSQGPRLGPWDSLYGEHILALMHDMHTKAQVPSTSPWEGTRRKHWCLMTEKNPGSLMSVEEVIPDYSSLVSRTAGPQTTARYQLSLKNPIQEEEKRWLLLQWPPLTSEIPSVLGFHWGLPISTGYLSYICSLLFS